MNSDRRRCSERGYSLLEVAMVLVVMGIIAVVTISQTPRLVGVFQARTQAGVLVAMDRALLGFALSRSRLPCPDSDADGREDCAGPAVGSIPYQTLGLGDPARNARGLALRYSVYRNSNVVPQLDADLAVVKNRYAPLLPPAAPPSTRLNGLDFCSALRQASLAVGSTAFTHIGVAARNVAFAIADPGLLDADANGNFFDRLNSVSGVGFEPSDQALSATYDDRVLASSFNQLASRMDCPAAVAEINGFARAAFAAADLQRLADLYQQFRDFAVRVNTNNVAVASEQRDLAIAGVALGVVSVALAIATGGETFGAAAFAIGLATAQLALAVANLVIAQMNLDGANAALATAIVQQANANAALISATSFAAQRLAAVSTADGKGLLR